MRVLRTAAAVLLAVSLTSTLAEARPKHHHHHRHHKHQVHRQSAPAQHSQSWALFGGSQSLVAEAQRWIGATAAQMGVRRSLWCAAALNKWLRDTGHKTSGSNQALSYAHYGRRIQGPRVGAIAVMKRRGGGHVGVVSGIDPNGNPIVISGNHNNRVEESVYRNDQVAAYVLP